MPHKKVRESAILDFRCCVPASDPMNIGRLSLRSVFCLALGLAAHRSIADPSVEASTHISGPNTRLRQEVLSLIRHDAAQQRLPRAAAEIPEENAESPETDRVVVLDPFDVRGERDVPDISVPRENRVEKFFRTGTFRQHIGKKVTTRFWSSGADGIVLSFRW